jgi:hypothetical protein
MSKDRLLIVVVIEDWALKCQATYNVVTEMMNDTLYEVNYMQFYYKLSSVEVEFN